MGGHFSQLPRIAEFLAIVIVNARRRAGPGRRPWLRTSDTSVRKVESEPARCHCCGSAERREVIAV